MVVECDIVQNVVVLFTAFVLGDELEFAENMQRGQGVRAAYNRLTVSLSLG